MEALQQLLEGFGSALTPINLLFALLGVVHGIVRTGWAAWLPLAFAATCLYMLWSSLAYVQLGALLGVGVLFVGALLLWAVDAWGNRRSRVPVESGAASRVPR